jgi:hypothetical protein
LKCLMTIVLENGIALNRPNPVTNCTTTPTCPMDAAAQHVVMELTIAAQVQVAAPSVATRRLGPRRMGSYSAY